MPRGKKAKSPPGDKTETRTLSWTLIVYPESLPPNWEELLDEHHIQWACSPLHDKDLTAIGEAKKPHYHLLLVFPSVKSYEQVRTLTECLNGPIPQRCHDTRALARYMCHLDNPDKAQYKVEDIKAHGGLDIKELLKSGYSERHTILKEMTKYCRDNQIIEIQDLIDYAELNNDDWHTCLAETSLRFMEVYIRSQRHRMRQSPAEHRTITIDTETGEIKG